MAEVVILKPVADILISLAKTEVGLAWGVKNEIRMLSSALTTIGAVVADAEVKQLKNKAIQLWLIKLKHAAYDAQDVFHDLAIDEPELLQPDPTAENCCNSVWISCLSLFMQLKRLVPHYKIANKIKPVRERFDRIVNEMSNFGLIERVVDHVEGASMIPPQSISEHRVTSSASAEPHMYGRDVDKENIIKMLLENVDNEHGLSVCPILGIGGLGKTTLAQFVCKDDRVKNHFHVQIWVCVSDHFNVKRLLKEIVEIVTESRFDHDNLDVIRGGVVEQLRGKRFLLVLDDVWSDKHDVWNMLKDPLTTGAKGSSIIVTTRLKTVASITKTISEPYQLDGLSDDDCWSLFTFYAFEAGKESDNPNLVAIGKEIIKKCGGLPLAAKALGSMLRFKVEEKQWREVRDSEIWELDEEEGSSRQLPKILPALRLSYNNLSARARQCFAYCCFFPKDYKMRKEELVYIWLANGLLEFKNKEPEDVGEDVFGELLLHSFFQDMKKNEEGKIETVKIHDLMHDLASAIMKSEYLHIEVKVGMSINSSIQDDEIKTRHISLVLLPSSSETSSKDVSSIYRFLSSHQCYLRTLFLFLNEDKGMSDSCDVISVVSGLKNLRALRVESWNAKISTLPLSFGDKLKHLRYLNLRHCGLSSLHGESFRGMKNLQFLDLSQNNRLKTLPDSMGEYMEHLKHLNLSGCGISSLHAELFRGMKNLQFLDLSQNGSLKTLPDSMGEYMEHLKHLNLSGCGLSSLHAELFRGMKNLQILDLSQNKSLKTLPDSMGEYIGHLKLLNLSGCDLSSLHGESFRGMKNLQFLDLSENESLKTLPDSMCECMEHLKHLNLSGCGLSSLHVELFRGMKNLRILDLSQNKSLETLPNSMGEYMEHLKHLNLRGCGLSSLHGNSFRGMKNLQILDLSENESLKTLPDSMCECMEHLKHLNLSGCGLSSLHGELFRGMKKLQFLDLSRNSKYMETIPDSIGNLEQLRHLKLSDNKGLKVLPESLGNLTKLETLKLNDCWGLLTLPQSTSKLCSLRQLENHGCYYLRGMPSGIGQGLSRLEKLSMWVWGSEESENIEGLRCLSLLGGSLQIRIKGLRKDDDAALRDGEEVLTNKTNLSKLVIWFSYNGGDDVSSSSEQALRILKPPSNIESLIIESYKGRRFPEWMEMRDPHSSSSFPRLRTIHLKDIKYLEEWVLNWRHKEECLPALQHLYIRNCAGLKGLPKELGNLVTLKSLDVYYCKELVSVPQLICLEALSIMKCSELVSMPQLELMTSLKELSITECPKLKFVFHRLRHLTSLQRLRISECPMVVIPKEELDPLVALRGPSFLKRIDKKLIHEDSTTTTSETRGKQVFQVLIDDDLDNNNSHNKDVDEVLIHDHYHDYSQSKSTTTTTTTTVPEIIRGKQVLQLPTHDDNARAVSD